MTNLLVGFTTRLSKAMVIVVIAALLAITVNAASPTGIPWSFDWDDGVRTQAVEAAVAVLTLDEAKTVVDEGTRVALDARSAKAFEHGHIPGALSCPIASVDEAFPMIQLLLAADEPILVYCSSATCDQGLRLVLFLQEQGYRDVVLFVDGFDAWKVAGEPIETGL